MFHKTKKDSWLARIRSSWCLVMVGTEYRETVRAVSLPVTTSCLAGVMHTERVVKGENQDILLLLAARVTYQQNIYMILK